MRRWRRGGRDSAVREERPAEGVALLHLDRPGSRPNALDVATQCELFGAFERLDGDPAVRCIVVTGTDKVFAAGIDLKEMAGASAVDAYLAAESIRRDRLRQIRTPIIAAVAGSA